MGGGVRRKLDDLGRVVIPSSMRRLLGLRDGDELEVEVADGAVVLRKPTAVCTFCGSGTHLEQLHGKPVCWSCLGALRQKARGTPADPAAGSTGEPT